MVADAVYEVPHPGNLASEAVTPLSDDACPNQEHPSRHASSQDGVWRWMRQSNSDEDEKRDIIFFSVKEENDSESESLCQAVDDQDDQDDRLYMVDEDELDEAGQDGEQFSSSRHLEDESQGKKGCGGPGWLKKSQQKMNHGKQWIADHLLFVTTAVSVVSLSDIEEAYSNACQREGREPLTRYVLARLIHQQFPEAGKCRRGSRGNQKIHYNRLQWRVSSYPNQHHLNAATSSELENEAAEGTPSDDKPSGEMPSKDKKPASRVSRRDNVQDPGPGKKDGMLWGSKESVATAAHHPVTEDEDEQEGCEDAAKQFVQVVKSIKLQGKFDVLLKTFAHSASCNNSPCSSLCLMFRRVRRHVVNARHPCHVMRIYSVMLKLHVAGCNSNNCGMTGCPALRASRQLKRGRDDELQEEEAQLEQQQCDLKHVSKKLNVQAKRPSFLNIRPPSPALSLPDSLPSTPSPLMSPSHTLPLSPVRSVSSPPLGMMKRVARMPSVNVGAA